MEDLDSINPKNTRVWIILMKFVFNARQANIKNASKKQNNKKFVNVSIA